ncbi:GNAT family N-acetyltransferase [Marinilactibacillus kalidii]|uniref:GNAT family N-acetyltransferase n=1 Tax=Marinilactibacillus kalidii TaxID=2820274 RepID=UPI001ABDCB00|nr:GNAT family N-acetyltransferase [Marinilactibacillus kalidii]
MKFKWTEDTSSKVYNDALLIRKTVFVEEQKVPVELEIDELEAKTMHVVGYLNESAVATARIYQKEPGIFKIQRVAVLQTGRKKGTGKELMAEVERKIRTLESHQMVLDAQDYALSFYEKCGFTIEGKGFPDAGIPHHKMTKDI